MSEKSWGGPVEVSEFFDGFLCLRSNFEILGLLTKTESSFSLSSAVRFAERLLFGDVEWKKQ